MYRVHWPSSPSKEDEMFATSGVEGDEVSI